MNTNLDSLKYVVTYKDGAEQKRSVFSNYDIAVDYFEEKRLSIGNAKLFIEHTITTEVRIK